MPEYSTCQSCGELVAPNSRFCPSCGSHPHESATVLVPASMERITTDRLVQATQGEFEVLRQIGSGAMGSVYLARDIALGRRVAVKVISPQLLQDEAMVARFLLEAQTVASLRHPHIVNLHAVRQLGDLHYFVMDFIDGPSLQAVLKEHGPLDLPVVQALLFQVGGALNYAHRRGVGVIHRDVKPANIMIDREGNAVVMDFGIAKIGAAQTGLTQAGVTIGTPEYMSPEQCLDADLTGASDQYALGIVAYEMLAGVQPFSGGMYAVMMAHAEGTPPPLRELRPDCPPEVEAAVLRMMAKTPEERFPDVADAVAALGGKPLDHDDPVRDAIVTLVQSVSDDESGLDYSSPLSPLTAVGQESEFGPLTEPEPPPPTRAPAADTETLILPAREPIMPPPDLPGEMPIPKTAWGEWVVSTGKESRKSRRRWPVPLAAVVIVAALGWLSPSVRDRLTYVSGSSASVGLAAVSDTLSAGDTLRLQATILQAGAFQPAEAAAWGSSDDGVASVDGAGLVTAHRAGVAVISVTFDEIEATAEVVVRGG